MVILAILVILILGLVLFLITALLQRKIGLPMGNMIYSDSQKMPGQIMSAKSIPLSGKPDYLLKDGKFIIPVELKTGKTPRAPYANHVAQLYAYCLLVEETYGVRPPYGIIDYPEQDFELEFTHGTEEHLKKLIHEILARKKRGELTRDGFTHVCRTCREGHLPK